MQWVRLFAVLYVSIFLFGMNVGIQGMFTTVAKRGVFSDECKPQYVPYNHSDNNAGSSADQQQFMEDSSSSAISASTEEGGRMVPQSLPCLNQDKQIAAVVNIMLSVTNLVALPNGFIIDWLGGEVMAILAVGTWVVCQMIAGINPGNGIIWSIAVITVGWANNAAFMAFSTLHLRQAVDNDKGKYAFWSTVSMACRAIGALASIPMSYFLDLQGVDFWLLYMIWGFVVGVPVLVVFIVLFVQARRKRKAEEEEARRREDMRKRVSFGGAANPKATSIQNYGAAEEGNGGEISDVEEKRKRAEAEKKKKQEPSKIKKALSDLRAVAFTLPFLTVTIRLCVLITFGSLFIANVGALARYKGADKAQIESARQHFTYFLGALGATNPIPGFLIKRTGPYKGISFIAILSIIFCAVYMCTALLGRGSGRIWVFYISFAFFAIWRYWSYGVCALYVPVVFPDRQAGFGMILGTMSGIGGGLSIGLGTWLTHTVQANPDMIPTVFCIFAGLEFIVDIMTVFSMRSKKAEDDAKAKAAEEEERLINERQETEDAAEKENVKAVVQNRLARSQSVRSDGRANSARSAGGSSSNRSLIDAVNNEDLTSEDGDSGDENTPLHLRGIVSSSRSFH